MKQQNSKWMLLAFAAVTMLLVQPLRAEVLEKTMTAGGMTVRYKVVLPNDYDPAKAYPAILAFGGGPQDMITVDNILNRNFRAEAEKRGYIVVAPAAPDGELFFREGARIFPEFLKMIMADHKIEDGKISRRWTVEWGNCGPTHCGLQSAIFPVRHVLSRIHAAARRHKVEGDLQDVRFHVCR